MKYENFSTLGGSTPSHSRTDDADICRRQHEQGGTCVAIWSRNRAAVAALVARANTTTAESAHLSTSRRIDTVASTMRRCGVKQKACSPPVSDFAGLNLSRKKTRIVEHLQRNKDQLSRTENSLFQKNRSTLWVLANRLDAPRLAPVRSLAEQTAVQLRVPSNEIYEHVNTRLFDFISREGTSDRQHLRLSTRGGLLNWIARRH